MTGGTVAELLADLIGTAGDECPAPTPAKAANLANRQQGRGLALDLVACEDLRKPAKTEQQAAKTGPVSQGFAALRSLPDGLESVQGRGLSQVSQDSQGWPKGEQSQRPYRLTKTDADRCHAPEWQDGEIARFSARVQRFARLGIGADDADDLAERLTLRDHDGDKRAMCAECSHYRPGRCRNHKAAGLQSPELGRDLAALFQRCAGFETAR